MSSSMRATRPSLVATAPSRARRGEGDPPVEVSSAEPKAVAALSAQGPAGGGSIEKRNASQVMVRQAVRGHVEGVDVHPPRA